MTEATDTRIIGPLVDAHAHVFDGKVPLADEAWHAPAGEGTTEDLLASFDRAGVHFGVLAAASIFGDYNDYMRNAARRNKRLRTTVIVQPNVELETLKAMDADGVVGIRLQFRSTANLPDLSSFEYRKLFRRLADLNWHVHLHDQGERLHQSIPHIENAGVRLVIDHFGRPDLSLGVHAPGFKAVLEAIARGQTWMKLSAAFRLTPLEKLREFSDILIANAGPERLLWGSDWPFVAYEQGQTYASTLQDYYSLVPDPSVRHAIDRTALKFYFV